MNTSGGSAVDALGRPTVVGPVAENAAAAGNPVLVGGRYDAAARTLGDGDVGAVAVNASGQLILSATVTGSNTVQDDAGVTSTQAKGDTQGVQYVRAIGQFPTKGRPLYLPIAVTGTFTTAIQATAKDYLCEEVAVVFRNRNTDAEGLVGDSVAQTSEIKKGESLRLGAIDPRNLYLKAHTTAADDADVHLTLVDRPDFARLVLEAIYAVGSTYDKGFYLPMRERSGTAILDSGDRSADFTLSGAMVADAGVFGFGQDFDGTNDFLVQKSEAVQVGTVTVTETNGSAGVIDTGVTMTTYKDGGHWIQVADVGGNYLHGFIGTGVADVNTIAIFSETARTTQNWVEGGATAFTPAGTNTYKIFKEAKPSTAFTIGCWIVADTVTGSQYLISNHEDTVASQSQVRLFLSGGQVDFLVHNTSGTSFEAVTPATKPIKIGQRYFIVVTYEASTAIRVYINGVQEAVNTTTIPSTLNTVRTPWHIGCRPNTPSTQTGFFNGRISHPFYIKALKTANWIRTAYELSRRDE